MEGFWELARRQDSVTETPSTTRRPTSTGTVSSAFNTRTPITPTSLFTSTRSSAFITATATPSSRPTSQDQGPSSRPTFVIVGVILAAVLFILFFLFIFLRRTRRRHANPKYLPTPFLKKIWRNWEPASNKKLPRNNQHFEPIGTAAARRLGPSAAERERGDGTGDIGTANVTVDRNTSVRSVMTLPAYRPNAHQNEQVLGREGERAGIDVVVEFPETHEEEERLREEEMEALYQVRLARRRENEERDERRRLRREARERGDYVALREIQARARAASNAQAGRSVDELRAEHERLKRERNRAVSSVSYADLGVARHDGTRIRANSEESERTGLLGDAASFGAGSAYHRRERSASSVISIDTMNSDLPSPGFSTRPRGSSGVGGEQRRGSNLTIEGRAGSSPEMVEHEDANSPPGYENISLDDASSSTPQPHHTEPPPNYSSPTAGRGEIDALSQLPPTSQPSTSTSTSTPPSSQSQTPQPPQITTTDPNSRPPNQRGENSSESLRARRESRSTSRSPGRGVGGVPQLPSLRLGSLPSIHVDPGSPRVGRRIEEEREGENTRP